jgi:hypothetical protein
MYVCAFQTSPTLNIYLLRTKIEAVIKRGDGVADPDAPDDASSTRFWVTTGAKYFDREKVGVSMTAAATVKTTAATMDSMLGSSSSMSASDGGGCLALTNGSTASTQPSLEALVNVMTGSKGDGAPSAKGKAKAKAKPKAKGAALQTPKTPAERIQAIRTLILIHPFWSFTYIYIKPRRNIYMYTSISISIYCIYVAEFENILYICACVY